jgi:transcription-repair coupling factor (superfamily II helicase)
MPTTMLETAPSALTDLTKVLAAADGFAAVFDALKRGQSGAIDGAWGSSSALAAAALASQQPCLLLIVLAHEGDVDIWDADLQTFTGQPPVHFPAWDQLPTGDTLLDEVYGQRLRVLKRLGHESGPRVLLTTMQALLQPVPSRAELAERRRELTTGHEVRLEELVTWLVEHGLTRRETVELPGEFSRRGGILDVYPPDADAPLRIEFFGDVIDSIRRFAADTQRSLGEVQSAEITGFPRDGEKPSAPGRASAAHFSEYLPANAWIALVEPGDLHEQGKAYLDRTADVRGLFSVEAAFKHLLRLPSVTISTMPASTVETICHLRVESVERFSGEVSRVREELQSVAAGSRVIVACHNEAERQRLRSVLQEDRGRGDEETRGQGDKEKLKHGDEAAAGQGPDGVSVSPCLPVSLSPCLPDSLSPCPSVSLLLGHVRAGFRLVDGGLVVLSDHELFHRQDLPARRQMPRRHETRAIDSFLDLAEGDLVVHISHGIGRYRGMQVLQRPASGPSLFTGAAKASAPAEEHLILEFAEGTKLYVPASKIDLVQKYVGGGQSDPHLSKLGALAWQKRKERVQEAVFDLATEMIDLQAVREAQPGVACPPDTDWQAEFEATFPYQETQDQLAALAEIKADLERGRPTDRLICGDVGFGKTELAIRAAFKMMEFGKQVAVLVPTTVLAEQHYRTFHDRLAEYPFAVECLSRFRTTSEQKQIVKRLAEGNVDLVIGTHRLLSADVQFKDLGLVIIDEEQRFGVEHKERLKHLRTTVDVLTLTATPIPRTLHLSLLGIRDISNLETPPRDRLAIETRITRWDAPLLRHAILRELNREGQVFFVHNRVYNIQAIAGEVQSIVPEARIAIGHGQMPEHELEEAMLKFVRRECDVLVATTIIESGLDIPNANTIFINQADQYGLADLHQLRGRVGRYKHRAYCYLLLDPNRSLTPTASKRLKAIEEFTELGAGFKIAMRDLEIRGAGNILGTQQSGHIAAIGYELYCQLLENAVRRLKNLPVRTGLEVSIELPWEAFLPRDYVPGQRNKIEVYRRLSRIRDLERLTDFRKELVDRFGAVPQPAEWLIRSQELRILTARWQIAEIHMENKDLVLGYRNRKRIDRLASLSGGRLRVVDAESAYCRLKPPELDPQRIYELLKALLQSPA